MHSLFLSLMFSPLDVSCHFMRHILHASNCASAFLVVLESFIQFNLLVGNVLEHPTYVLGECRVWEAG